MTDSNYKMLQWSKEIIDEVVKDEAKYTKAQLVQYLKKMSGNFHLILLSEAKTFTIVESKN